jgi:hypothetical protein
MTYMKLKTTAAVYTVALVVAGTTTITIQHSLAASESTQLSFAGYDTPEATFKSLVAALAAADTKKFEEACTPEKAKQFRERNAGKSKDELNREADGLAKAFTQYKITQKDVISDTEVELHIKPMGDTSQAKPGDRNPTIRMKKIGKEWKLDVEPH